MQNLFHTFILSSSVLVLLSACSGGGGGSGGTGTTTTKATGALSIPDINCGSSACLNSSTSMVSPMAMNSAEEVAAYGELAYDKFNTEYLPKINENLYKMESTFKTLGYETCDQIVGISNDTDQSLGSGYTVTITSVTTTSPFGGTTSKRFVVKYSSDAVAEIQMGCSGTVRTIYVKVFADSTNHYEVWAKVDSANTDAKSLEAAADIGSGKLTLYFNSTSATAFTLGAIGKDYPNPYDSGTPISFSIFGQASLGSPKIAKISYSSNNAAAPPTSYSAPDTNWAGTSIGHCYSNLDSGTVDNAGTACSSLSSASPTTSGVRGHTGAGTTWIVNDYSTAIPGIL